MQHSFMAVLQYVTETDRLNCTATWTVVIQSAPADTGILLNTTITCSRWKSLPATLARMKRGKMFLFHPETDQGQ